MYVYYMRAWYLWESEEGIGSFVTKVKIMRYHVNGTLHCWAFPSASHHTVRLQMHTSAFDFLYRFWGVNLTPGLHNVLARFMSSRISVASASAPAPRHCSKCFCLLSHFPVWFLFCFVNCCFILQIHLIEFQPPVQRHVLGISLIFFKKDLVTQPASTHLFICILRQGFAV